MEKNGNFFCFKKKADFRAIFLLFTASVRSRPPGPPAVPGVFILVTIFDLILYTLTFCDLCPDSDSQSVNHDTVIGTTQVVVLYCIVVLLGWCYSTTTIIG